jgi:aspartyl-tRNA synthetase
MSFVTQEDVFDAIEPVLAGVFREFAKGRIVDDKRFPRIAYDTAMLKYGSDKPDLRNPLVIADVSEVFVGSDFKVFAGIVAAGGTVRAVPAPKTADRPRSFFDKMNAWAQSEGVPGLGYIVFEGDQAKGPIAKFLDADRLAKLKALAGVGAGDAVFFVADKKHLPAAKLAGAARKKLGEELDLIEPNAFRFCWIVDFPMYERDEETGKIEFSHNPFSMPQGGLEALNTMDPLAIKAFQYDIVCNGVELSSGAIRNHLPEIMYRAFEIAGYGQQEVESRFGGMLNAFKFGAPPHGGSAPGIDRIVMLLANEPNIREVVAFPMTQGAVDLLMQAPNNVDPARFKELHIKLDLPVAKK